MYKALAHPEWDGYVTPYTFEERLMHAREAERTIGSRYTWLVDGMDNAVKEAFGGAPNSEWVVDENNVIVARRGWSNPEKLRGDLERLVGPVEEPTRVEDLDMPRHDPPEPAASGVVPRVDKPGRMIPVVVEPMAEEDGEPYYAKLRVEVDRDVVRRGEGKMYVRFMMDPLYNVHWNNLTEPIRVRIEGPEGVSITPSEWRGPEVEAVEGDVDPRAFLGEASGLERGDEIVVRARYFACNSDEGWCVPVEHAYRVRVEPNRHGGFVIPKPMERMFEQRMKQRRRGGGGGASDRTEGQ